MPPPLGTLMRYVLDEHGRPVVENDLDKWAVFFNHVQNRTVGKTMVGKILVSTVFLALDHSFSNPGKPILWETMCFSGDGEASREWGDYTRRCGGNREQAEAMHREVVAEVRAKFRETLPPTQAPKKNRFFDKL